MRFLDYKDWCVAVDDPKSDCYKADVWYDPETGFPVPIHDKSEEEEN